MNVIKNKTYHFQKCYLDNKQFLKLTYVRNFSERNKEKFILNVAEKPSVARLISEYLSQSRYKTGNSLSKFNPNFEFVYEDKNIKIKNYDSNKSYHNKHFIVTSISGHLKSFSFDESLSEWNLKNTIEMFETEPKKCTLKSMTMVEKNILKIAQNSQEIILWIDNDREGENICYEVIDSVLSVNSKIKIKRAIFSAVTEEQIEFALNNLSTPNISISNAVDVRQIYDLIIGSTLTRLQTLFLKEIFMSYRLVDNKEFLIEKYSILSYGPCQFPTLSLIIEQYNKVNNFVSSKYYTLAIIINGLKFNLIKNEKILNKDNDNYDEEEEKYMKNAYNSIKNTKLCKVEKIVTKDTYKKKPLGLNTVVFIKLGIKEFGISGKKLMEIAEVLYQDGFISYPRTETESFPKQINTYSLLHKFVENDEYGDYVNRLINTKETEMFSPPRKGVKDDESHPPIYPVKLLKPDFYSSNLYYKVYLLILKHFLAVVSKDAVGEETYIEVSVKSHLFSFSCNRIISKGYLEIYDYDNWQNKSINLNFKVNDKIKIDEINLDEKMTQPPRYITEYELVDKMDKNKIGTDSTIQEHINTIFLRNYCVKQGNYIIPSIVGLSLYYAYQILDIPLFDVSRRSKQEEILIKICNNKIDPDKAIIDLLKESKIIFDKMVKYKENIKDEVSNYLQNQEDIEYCENSKFNEKKTVNDENIVKYNDISGFCYKCNGEMKIKTNATNNSLFLGCNNFPKCKNTISINNPTNIEECKCKCEVCKKQLYNTDKDEKICIECLINSKKIQYEKYKSGKFQSAINYRNKNH